MECPICCSKYTATIRAPVICLTCDEDAQQACKVCAQTYIVSCDSEPSCMFCKNPWDRSFLTSTFTSKFINTEVKKKIEKILFDQQIAQLPETQAYVQQKIRIKSLNKRIEEANEVKRKLYEQIREQNILIDEFMRGIRVIHNGGNPNDLPTRTNNFTYKCPCTDCKGFLDSKWVCGLCTTKICKDCMEPLEEGHVCDEGKKESVKFLKKDTKPCPTCGEMIHKINGCDQMWCIHCRTAFSWKTGVIQRNHVHNPEYYRWMRETRQTLQREPGDQPGGQCGQVDHYSLLNKARGFVKLIYNYTGPLNRRWHTNSDHDEVIVLHNAHRYYMHIRHVIFPVNLQESREVEYRELRASYLMNEIDDDDMKKKLQIIDKKYSKKEAQRNIYVLIESILGENLGAITALKVEPSNKEVYLKIINDLSKFRNYINSSFERCGKVYGGVYPGIRASWYEESNWKKYIRNIPDEKK